MSEQEEFTGDDGLNMWPQPQKMWDELEDGEKIARMREIVKMMDRSLTSLQATIHSLEGHQHMRDRLMVGLHDKSIGYGEIQALKHIYPGGVWRGRAQGSMFTALKSPPPGYGFARSVPKSLKSLTKRCGHD